MVSISFLIAFSASCCAVYVANVAKEEMLGIFAAIVALLGFFFSLVFAPWLVQALMLITVLVYWRNLSYRPSRRKQ